MGPMEQSATRPKLSSAAWRSVRMDATPMPSERDSHRAGGDAARVERNREEIAGGKKRQAKHNQVKYCEQVAQRNAEQHTQQRDDQKRTHAACNRKDQRHIGDRGYLFGEHLQIRFGNGDDKAKQEG